MSIYEKILNEIKADYYIQNYANDGQRFVAWYLEALAKLHKQPELTFFEKSCRC